MAKLTLTEALAKHKLTLKKIDDTIRDMSHYTVRDERLVDPLVKSGSSSTIFISTGRQSIADLSTYAVRLRAAISTKNKEVMVDVGKVKMSIEDAITWRREVLPKMLFMYDGMLTQARKSRESNKMSGISVEVKPVVNFDEQEVMASLTELKDIEANLDMQLSIANATQMVEV